MAFDEGKIAYAYEKGYYVNQTEVQEELVEEALAAGKDYEKILIFAGLTDNIESEGCDRESMKLPENQLALIDRLLTLGKKIIIVLYGGSSMELPFADRVDAILDLYLPGQNGGLATRELLFGAANPSGRLAETWVKRYEDVPFADAFGKSEIEVYRESVYVGYRYYTTSDKAMRYPFGYGLSYTDFAYDNCNAQTDTNGIQVSAKLTNTGAMDGAEVVQCYVSGPRTELFKPVRELKAFTKVWLNAGETKAVQLEIPWEELRIFSLEKQSWVLEEGNYKVQLCKNAEEVIWEATVQNATGARGKGAARTASDILRCDEHGEQLVSVAEIYHAARLEAVTDAVFEQMSGIKIPARTPSLPITLESRFTDLQQTFLGRILFHAVLSTADKSEKEALKLPEGTERDNRLKGAVFLRRILESNSLMTMCMSAGKSLPYHVAVGMAELANGHVLRGVKLMLSAPKAPKLPKE